MARDTCMRLETRRLWIRPALDEIKYLIFVFLRCVVVAKRGVEFRHSTYSLENLVETEKRKCLNGNGVS